MGTSKEIIKNLNNIIKGMVVKPIPLHTNRKLNYCLQFVQILLNFWPIEHFVMGFFASIWSIPR